MGNLRLFYIILIMVLTGAGLTLGIVALNMANDGLLNTTNFDRGDENVFVSVNANYSGPALSSSAQGNYSLNITRENASSYDETSKNNSWNLSKTNFTMDESIITLTFSFANLNNINKLSVTFSDIAVDENARFTTSYAFANTQTELSNKALTNLAKDEEIKFELDLLNNAADENDDEMIVKIVYELKKYDENFELKNNINVLMESVYLP